MENQFIDSRKSHHQKYQKSRVQSNISNTDADSIFYTDTDTDNSASPNKLNLHKWPKYTVLIVGDCMILGMDEKQL